MRLPKIQSHGMTRWDYVTHFRAQNGRCAVCGDPPSPDTVFQWDHDHSHCPGPQGCRECVRALVCGPCNTRIAVVENALRFDTQPILDYLQKWAERQPAS